MTGVPETITVKYKSTTVPYTAKKWLNALPDTFAADFEATGLGHPARETITHLSVAWSDRDAFVILNTSPTMERIIMRFLVETNAKQIWHNLSFDGKYIMHRTGEFPQNYEDTQVLAWSLLNHADVFKAKSGLKELMGWAYGEWAIAKDLFGTEYMFEDRVIKYAATDACATYKLWEQIQEELYETNDS